MYSIINILVFSSLKIDVTRQAIQFELETLGMRPEQETLLMDMIHAVSIKLF